MAQKVVIGKRVCFDCDCGTVLCGTVTHILGVIVQIKVDNGEIRYVWVEKLRIV